MEVSIYNHDKSLIKVKKKIMEMGTPQANKNLLLEFADDCLTGWKVPKVSKQRVVALLQRLSQMTAEISSNGSRNILSGQTLTLLCG